MLAWTKPGKVFQSYCGFSIHEDIHKPPGRGPGQPGLGGSAGAGGGQGDLPGSLSASALW